MKKRLNIQRKGRSCILINVIKTKENYKLTWAKWKWTNHVYILWMLNVLMSNDIDCESWILDSIFGPTHFVNHRVDHFSLFFLYFDLWNAFVYSWNAIPGLMMVIHVVQMSHKMINFIRFILSCRRDNWFDKTKKKIKK